MRTSRFRRVLTIVTACLLGVPFSAGATDRAAFTVRDSIEMVTFSDPYTRSSDAEAQESPDGHGFVVVTTRGILETNQLESSLWYFSRADVNAFLSGARTTAPKPRLVYRRRGTPIAMQTNSYGSLISDLHWSPDSASVLAQVEQPNGNLHLFRIGVVKGDARDLTPGHSVDVRGASTGGGSVTYLSKTRESVEKSSASEDASIVRTGQSIYHILFPESFPNVEPVSDPWKLKVQSSSGSFELPSQPGIYFPISAVHSFRPTMSPNGRYVLAAMSVSDIPLSWQFYETAQGDGITKEGRSALGPNGRSYDWPWQYVLVDAKKQQAVPLFDAPTGYAAGYGDVLSANWSKDSDRVIVTNTYLPINLQAPSPHSIGPCAIAVYEVSGATSSCVAKTASPEKNEYLLSAAFVSSASKVEAQWLEGTTEQTRIYSLHGREWQEVDLVEGRAIRHDIRLYLRQDIDQPPTMWASDGAKEKLLWDPNPQIHNKQLGRGSVYAWTDASGYTWHGGLILPPGPKPSSGYPLVIQTHGFHRHHEFLVDGAYTTGFAAQPLANSGIAVLQMEDRSDWYSRPAAEEADNAVRGIESAIQHLAGDGFIDIARIGIIGFSRTHWYVEKALERTPALYAAATLIDGIDQSYVTDVLFAVDFPIASKEKEAANNGKPYGPGLSGWVKNAPGFHLDEISTPIRLEAIGQYSVLGEWETYSILRQQGKPVDLIEIPHGQHILQKPRERYASQQGNVDWFRFWLQGFERKDQDVAWEYSRWKAFREQLGAKR